MAGPGRDRNAADVRPRPMRLLTRQAPRMRRPIGGSAPEIAVRELLYDRAQV
ncbi:hypothetical protein GCM10022223_05110 [Kineosporia mesophila]|uniref:Uncharacterized protein n=1 Tax=Kineosporia mesophila TaxID=566012 RepID=A0ABP6YWV9_9ACTN